MYNEIISEKQIELLEKIARDIWSEHFGTLFESDTLTTVIKAAQSKEVIKKEITAGYRYFFIEKDDKTVGYFSYRINPEASEIFLNKIYIYKEFRRMGIGRLVINYLIDICTKNHLTSLRLDVYSKNINSVIAYEKIGFVKCGTKQKEFSEDLVFTDFIMVLKV